MTDDQPDRPSNPVEKINTGTVDPPAASGLTDLQEAPVSLPEQHTPALPQAERAEDQSAWTLWFLVAMAILAFVFFGGPVWAPIYNRYFGLVTLGANTCTENTGQVEKMVAESPSGRTYGYRIVTWKEIKTISVDKQKVSCRATVTLNDDEQLDYSYSFTEEGGKIMIRGAATK